MDCHFTILSFDVVDHCFWHSQRLAKDKALGEFFRVLKPSGRLIVLAFSMPKNAIVNVLYRFYFRHILPRVGGFLSKNSEAYRYLNRSVEAFFNPEEFRNFLLRVGFSSVEVSTLSFGIATIYCAGKS